jgi:DNA replicative helicase MCM subunit Mcm2 (Cdc46/Mcm family)
VRFYFIFLQFSKFFLINFSIFFSIFFLIFFLQVIAVANGSQTSNDKTQLEFTLLDYSAIQELFSLGPELFKLLVASLCPSIYGHELVKAGLVLTLFGGTSKYANDRAHVSIRGD